MGKPTMWFPNRSDTNRPVQLQKQARSLKFWSKVEEELYYPVSENKGADQLRGYREADLRLCFRLCRLLVFPRGGSFIKQHCRDPIWFRYISNMVVLRPLQDNRGHVYISCKSRPKLCLHVRRLLHNQT